MLLQLGILLYIDANVTQWESNDNLVQCGSPGHPLPWNFSVTKKV